MPTLIIKNGTILTSSETYLADVFIRDEKIESIGKNLDNKADQVIEASGCYLIPGGIDAHTHMDLPFMGTYSSDDFESGTRAGICGGTTTIIDFAIQSQGDSLTNALNQWYEKASEKACGDYGFHMAVTDFNPKTRLEIPTLIHEHGITSFKTFMAYKGALMIDDRQMIGLMEEVNKHGGLVTVHAENGELVDALITKNKELGNLSPRFHPLSRPPIAEAEASGRIIDLAYLTNANLYIVHMSCEEALERVRFATKRNQKVYVETCVQYLLLDDSLYFQEGFEGAKYVMSPPLRKKKDQDSLWQGINQNLIEVVATDHCPFCMKQKEMGKDDFSKIPNGAPGVEHRIELLYTYGVAKGLISLNKWVDITSTSAAKIFGLYGRKGSIAVGFDADIVVFDPNKEHTISAKTHHMNCDYSAYEGWQLRGKCRQTLLRGQLVFDDGNILVRKGQGKYLKRSVLKRK